MTPVHLPGRVIAPALLLALSLAAGAAAAPDSTATRDVIRDSLAIPANPRKYEVVVSATRTRKDPVQIPNATAVIAGDELRRHGTRTVAEALQDVLGLDTGEGSDNGPQTPNIGMWGLKEFDALLVTVDGVPAGGPFNPNLTEIPVEDVDRIEIVKGPQGTLYGVSAFAGMVQVYTRPHDAGRGYVTAGGGSFSEGHGSFSVQQPVGNGWDARLSGQLQRFDGWQDRTSHDLDRGRLGLSGPVGSGHLAVDLDVYRDRQRWGSPLPYDAGALFEGFRIDRNYAIGGAELKHQFFGGSARFMWPLQSSLRFENTLAFTHDKRHELRSFVMIDSIAGGEGPSEGIELSPEETTIYEDARLVSKFMLAGAHEAVGGAAVTHGRTKGDGRVFDFDQQFGDPSTIPNAKDIAPAEQFPRNFEDVRNFTGVYLHDEWTPHKQFTLSGGGRVDFVDENLEVGGVEEGSGSAVADKARRNESAWSGDVAALVRLLPEAGMGEVEAANVYANWKSSFKPAAPNLSEAEEAKILDPERTHSVEVGFKARGFEHQASLDLSWFDMTFDNLVAGIIGPDGPELVNAGRERFKGVETGLTLSPNLLPGTSLTLGYAHHDARFVHFTFVTPDGSLRDVSGRHLELVPQELFNARLQVASHYGLGVFGAVRYQGRRPFNRRNTFFADAYSEYDAGAWYTIAGLRLTVTGRNLGDDRHVVTESEIGDSEFYVSPPRRVIAEASYSF
jgi:outer membrane receptor protein involved in Fe transport